MRSISVLAAALAAITIRFSQATALDVDEALDACHGYAASNIVDIPRGIQADLDLIGDGCRVHGPDVSELRLVVQYESG
jgi:alpha-glucosidase